MTVLPSAYPEQKPVYLRCGDPVALPEHTKYVSLREYLLQKTVATSTQEALELVGTRKGHVNVRSISEHAYNCVGMVLANRRVWIDMDTEAFDEVLARDGYRKILDGPVTSGDVALYENQDGFSHVGVVLCVESQQVNGIWILSKWGFAGEMIHRVLDVPKGYGRVSQYWTDRENHGIA